MTPVKLKYRPRAKGHEARENRVNLRYNDYEYALIVKQAAKYGLPVTTYAAQILLADATNKK